MGSDEKQLKVISKEDVAPLFSPLPKDAHKGNLGQLVVVGGSENYVGAPQLAALGAAAMLSGLGTSVLSVPEFLLNPLRSRVVLSSLFPLKTDGKRILFSEDEFTMLTKRATAFSVGMGFSDGEADKIVKFLLEKIKLNFVLDADGLKTACKTVNDFKSRAVLTPHLGEFAEISGCAVGEVMQNPAGLAAEFAKKHSCVLVLKSHESIVTDGGEIFVNKTGNAKLAKGGSGDVLSGIIGALLARGAKPLDAAKAGSFILGRCAEISAVNEFSHQATDTVSMIPKVIDELIAK